MFAELNKRTIESSIQNHVCWVVSFYSLYVAEKKNHWCNCQVFERVRAFFGVGCETMGGKVTTFDYQNKKYSFIVFFKITFLFEFYYDMTGIYWF